MSPSHLFLPERQPADPSRSVEALRPKSDAVPSQHFSDVMKHTTAAKSKEPSRPKNSAGDYEFDTERNAANSDVETAATNREEAVNNIVPLSASIAPIIPLPLSPSGQSISRRASGDAGSSDLESAIHEGISESGSANGLDLRTLGLQSAKQRESLVLNLRAAISRLEEAETKEMVAIASDSKIIPFPGQSIRDSKIIPVQFSPGALTALDPSTSSEAQLPPDGPNTEKSAGLTPKIARLEPVTGEASDTPKTNAKARFYGDGNVVGPNIPDGGTSTARRERNMDSRSASAHFDPLGDDGSLSEVSKDATELSASGLHVPPRLVSGAEWPSPAPWNAVNNVSSEVTTPVSVDAAAAVERISKMVNREATLFRQHTSDSMSVVLRPDANTELFLHLNRRDGQIEASVRCERGDFHQLNALWSQLQECLAQHKVRLNPLQESAGDPGSGLGSAFRDANGFTFSTRDESSRHARSDDDFMDEWPAPASRDQEPAHVRSRRESGHRLSTSRPGWETWA